MIYSSKDFDLRTKENYEEYFQVGTQKIPKFGIKGKTIISGMIEFPYGLPLDYMHLLCLGIFKSILMNWFDSSNHNSDYYIGNLFK